MSFDDWMYNKYFAERRNKDDLFRKGSARDHIYIKKVELVGYMIEYLKEKEVKINLFHRDIYKIFQYLEKKIRRLENENI